MKASIQNLIQDFNAVVFDSDELKSRYMTKLKALLPLLVNQNSKSDLEIIY